MPAASAKQNNVSTNHFMRRMLTLVAVLLLLVVLVCGFSFLTNNANYKTWIVQTKAADSSGIVWAKFYWGGDSFGKRYIERAAMQVPLTIDGFPYAYCFQFDLGASFTEIYEKNLRSLFATAPQLKTRVSRLKGPVQFWDSRLSVNDLRLHMGSITAVNEHVYLHRNYGSPLRLNAVPDSSFLPLGTIGADMFQNNVLLIDYPGGRFAVCHEVPASFQTAFVDIELDGQGRVILPMRFRGKRYRVTFDNGSSMFPLIAQAKYVPQFATGPDTDTLTISSWGKKHTVTGKRMQDTFVLAGRQFFNTTIYANGTGYGIDPNTDAMAGNALFWNHTIVIDFKNKKFGIK